MKKNTKQKEELKTWSKSNLFLPKNNIESLKCNYTIKKTFRASFERTDEPPSMKSLLSWEYARIWHDEHEKFIQKNRIIEKPKLKINIYGSKRIADKKLKESEKKATKSNKKDGKYKNKIKEVIQKNNKNLNIGRIKNKGKINKMAKKNVSSTNSETKIKQELKPKDEEKKMNEEMVLNVKEVKTDEEGRKSELGDTRKNLKVVIKPPVDNIDNDGDDSSRIL